MLERNWITKVDLLHIDTEGYDYEVIKQVDFEAIHLRLSCTSTRTFQMRTEGRRRNCCRKPGIDYGQMIGIRLQLNEVGH